MTNPLSMFHEKQADTRSPWSMTRVVAFVFAVTYCVALYTYSSKAFAINWPFAALGVCTLLAVPLQSIFTYLREWIASRPGTAMLQKVVEHFVPGNSPAVATSVSSTVTTSTDVSDKGVG